MGDDMKGDDKIMKKDLVPSSVVCPMLTSKNYMVSSMRMRVLLRVHKVWDAVESGSSEEEKNHLATTLLFHSILESLILQVGEQDSPKKIWEAIKSRNPGAERVTEARLQTLMSEFDRMRMRETENIDTFSGRMSEIASKSSALGQVIEEPKLVKKFLHGLPRHKFIHIIASLEQVLDLNKTGFEDIIGRFKAFEERISDEDSNVDTQQNLLYSNTEYDNSRGKFTKDKCASIFRA